MNVNEVVVGDYENELDAEIAKGHLDAAGIQSFIIKDDGGGVLPSLQKAEGMKLIVAKAVVEKARKILEPQWL